MECPRCDRPLDRYALQGREALACDSCGYIGVPVEHRGEGRELESWDDAISRFQEIGRVEAGSVETTDDDPTPEFVLEDSDGDDPAPTVVRIERSGESRDGSGADVDRDAGDGVACEVCGKRFDSRAQLNGHTAVHSGDE